MYYCKLVVLVVSGQTEIEPIQHIPCQFRFIKLELNTLGSDPGLGNVLHGPNGSSVKEKTVMNSSLLLFPCARMCVYESDSSMAKSILGISSSKGLSIDQSDQELLSTVCTEPEVNILQRHSMIYLPMYFALLFLYQLLSIL